MLNARVNYAGADDAVRYLRDKIYSDRNYIQSGEDLSVPGEIVISVWFGNNIVSSSSIFKTPTGVFSEEISAEFPVFVGRLVANKQFNIDSIPLLMLATFSECLANGWASVLGANDVHMIAALYNKFPFTKRTGPNIEYVGSQVMPCTIDVYGAMQTYTDIIIRQGTFNSF